MRCVKQVLILAVVLLMPCLVRAGYLTPDLQVKLDQASPNDKVRVIVRMAEEADISVFPQGQREAMVQHLRDFSAISQKDLLAALPRYGEKVSHIKPFWIYNGIAMEATKEVVLDLAKRSDVGYIEEDEVIRLEDTQAGSGPGINAIGWNITKIKADSVWRVLGYTGQGVVVGNIDTGVMVIHETFGGRWRGGRNSWFDAVRGDSVPYDDNGHGTGVMGVICGGSTAETIGVARGATFVCAKAFDSGGSGQTSWIDACYQWCANLGNSAPHVINHSWGMSSGSNTHFWQETRNLQVLGIHQSYAAGGGGPGGGTINSPGSYPHHIAVGATDISDAIASFSARGPAPAFGSMESVANYLDPNWASSRRKPDLSAPGVNIRTAYNNGGYYSLSGTSYSTPHVAGVIALMLQKNPNLTDRQIWQILTSTCDTFSFGGPYPNQNYGWGRLNAYRAVLATPPSGVDEEASRSPVFRLPFSMFPNPFISFAILPGHSSDRFTLYDISGRQVGTYRGDRIGEGLSAGVYFLKSEVKDAKPLRIVKLR